MTLLADAQKSSLAADDTTPARPHALPPLWDRQIRTAVDAVDDDVPRALLVGSTGSGKSVTLRQLHALLTRQGRDAVHAGSSTAIGRVPADHVLLVDDLHLLDRDQLAHVRSRAEDQDAALIAALRPVAWSEPLTVIAQRLERCRPAVVLGHLSRSDVLSYLAGHDHALPDECLDHILEATGGVSWLVSEALRAHDGRDCRHDTTHRELRRVLEDRIAHRLTTIDPELRREVERACIVPPGRPSITADAADAVIPGYAEGLLMRNGQPVPLVRSTVHATTPVPRLVAMSSELADGLVHAAAAGDPDYRAWLGLIHDRGLGEALVQHADVLLQDRPERAAELYRAAVESGIGAASLAGRRAEAAWASGDLRAASALVDDAASGGLPTDPGERRRLADTSAAVWAARGMMAQSCAAYAAMPPVDAVSRTRAAIVRLGTGAAPDLHDDEPDGSDGSDRVPSTLGVSMSLLQRGLTASVSPGEAEAALGDLVRASEMYTCSHASEAIGELPAVLAAIVALNLGGLATARSVIDAAIAGGQGGQWAEPRLLLWRAWIAVQLARPTEARDAVNEAMHAAASLSPRDALMAHAVQVAIARRYDDAAGLETAWRQARGSLLHVDMDLYLLHPLAELLSSASKVGDAERIGPPFQQALEIVERLGNPALWAAHLRWAGIQNGILRNSPDTLRPHAKALVDASPGSLVASTMAKAGRVWTSVLAGTVDADAVEAAAHGLASVGLVWDAARLAGHGAARSRDRKVSARLLACARELHPIDGSRRAVASSGTDAGTAASTPPEEILSERELEVARLVVEGKTYAEIGETIFISPRTAEHHIAHIRRRLGATSRSEVIAKLRQLIGSDAGQTGPARTHRGDSDAPP